MARPATKAQAERVARVLNRETGGNGARAILYFNEYGSWDRETWHVITDEWSGADAVTASYIIGDRIPGIWVEPVNSGMLAIIREA